MRDFQQRQHFAGELAPSEGVHFGDQHMRAVLAVKRQQAVAPRRTEGAVGRPPGGIYQR